MIKSQILKELKKLKAQALAEHHIWSESKLELLRAMLEVVENNDQPDMVKYIKAMIVALEENLDTPPATPSILNLKEQLSALENEYTTANNDFLKKNGYSYSNFDIEEDDGAVYFYTPQRGSEQLEFWYEIYFDKIDSEGNVLSNHQIDVGGEFAYTPRHRSIPRDSIVATISKQLQNPNTIESERVALPKFMADDIADTVYFDQFDRADDPASWFL